MLSGRPWLTPLFIVFFASTTGCSPKNEAINKAPNEQIETSDHTESTNQSSGITLEHILKIAKDTLDDIEDDFSWATAAAELAIAQSASEQNEEAWELLDQSILRAGKIEDKKQRANAFSELASSLSYLKPDDKFAIAHSRISEAVLKIENLDKRTDILGKLHSALAAHGQLVLAYAGALGMVAENPTQESYKLRTIREISVHMAKQGELDSSLEALANLEGDFTYYQAVARTDIAAANINQNKEKLIGSLLDEATQIGRSQENGYFTAGALRDVAYNHILQGNAEKARVYIEEARSAARLAKKQNERARSMSRIATKLADADHLSLSADIIKESLALAEGVESELMRNYSLYEIAGSAAFSDQFELAKSIIKDIPDSAFGSATSLKSASERDLSWGLAKHGHISEALEVAASIKTLRERVQALSRIARLNSDPEMGALPRYL